MGDASSAGSFSLEQKAKIAVGLLAGAEGFEQAREYIESQPGLSECQLDGQSIWLAWLDSDRDAGAEKFRDFKNAFEGLCASAVFLSMMYRLLAYGRFESAWVFLEGQETASAQKVAQVAVIGADTARTAISSAAVLAENACCFEKIALWALDRGADPLCAQAGQKGNLLTKSVALNCFDSTLACCSKALARHPSGWAQMWFWRHFGRYGQALREKRWALENGKTNALRALNVAFERKELELASERRSEIGFIEEPGPDESSGEKSRKRGRI